MLFPAGLLSIIFMLLIVGVALWVLGQLPGVDESIKRVIRILIIAVVAIWLIYWLFGMVSGGAFPIGIISVP
ncbi:MAG: hypothetical protein A2W35_06500 [Chloroflexi bacterium RBG_16_57_11]|nr:MAG: hypothetical protein A2W35_06500 [Chloroflexi bacterium RBG_16_57_11]